LFICKYDYCDHQYLFLNTNKSNVMPISVTFKIKLNFTL
jgi:hypothetical protein